MGDAAGQCADGFHLLGLVQPRLDLALLLLGAPAFADVMDKAAVVFLAAEPSVRTNDFHRELTSVLAAVGGFDPIRSMLAKVRQHLLPTLGRGTLVDGFDGLA